MEFSFGEDKVTVNMPTRDALMGEVGRRFRAGEGFALATINLDHLVKLGSDPVFARAYAGQDLVVADGRPIVALARLAQRPVELMPGSDLVRPLCALAAAERVPVALVGSSEVALGDAKRVLEAETPGLEITWTHAPEYGFDPEGAAAEMILKELATRRVGLCFLALGAPRQERLALRGRALAQGVGFASVGAGLDFLGGHQRRAPLWMRKLALEWVWRMLTDPLRLAPRYARCAAILPGHMVRALRLRGR
ncbi:WecB/TagA/CpsF family glycosyltransferase [Ruegeria pomeroyi]|nr:WecB/TagA/CpsF family glycosyltransferase [Ruegeria pomeroyi]